MNYRAYHVYMVSRWLHLKKKALQLRRGGLSLGSIESKLGIPRSTLSGWFRDIRLSSQQKNTLSRNKLHGLAIARQKALVWHNTQKIKRLQDARSGAVKVLERIDIDNKDILELALAILYLGEGSKKKVETALGSSDPLILKFFLGALKKLYTIPTDKIVCSLYLRADQDPHEIKQFWASELSLPLNNFKYVNLDKRTKNSKTYSYYKGVCQISGPTVAIQRKLLYLSNLFCEKITKAS